MTGLIIEKSDVLSEYLFNRPFSYNTNELEKDFQTNHSKFVCNITRFPNRKCKSASKKSLLEELT